MARIDIEDLDEDREIQNEEMKKAFGGFGLNPGNRFPSDTFFPSDVFNTGQGNFQSGGVGTVVVQGGEYN